MAKVPMSSNQERIDRAFGEWMRANREGRPLDSAAFIARQPEELREELERVLADFRHLRAGFADVKAGRVIGEYELLHELGRGAMGVVWEARQQGLDRHVALKLLHPTHTLNERALERFRREATAAGRLTHNCIAQVYAVGEDEGVRWIACELVPKGRSLANHIDDLSRLPELPLDHNQTTAALVIEIAEAVAAAHAEGIVHRDIKPANLLLDPAGRPKVVDFGLAQLEGEPSISITGEVTGTPYYMSPEQAAGKHMGLDSRTDVFSLGAVLYEVLTLRRPFEGETPLEVVEQILINPPAPPRRFQPRIPRDLATITLTALEKSRKRRYGSMLEFAADLRRFLADKPIQSRPPNPIRRSALWVRRHPAMSSSLAVLTLGLVVSVVLWLAAHRSSLRAQAALDTMLSTLELIDPYSPGLLLRIQNAREQTLALNLAAKDSAAVLTGLARVSTSAGLYAQASGLGRDALDLLDDDAPERPDVARELAHSYLRRASFDEANAVLAESLALRSTTPQKTRLEALQVICWLESRTEDLLDRSDARTRLEAAVQLTHNSHSAEGPAEALWHIWMTIAEHRLGSKAGGAQVIDLGRAAKENLATLERHLGPRHPDFLAARLAVLIWRAEASSGIAASRISWEAVSQEAIEQVRLEGERFEPEDAVLGKLHWIRGRAQLETWDNEARSTYAKAHGYLKKAHGERHLFVLLVRLHQVLAEFQQGEPKEWPVAAADLATLIRDMQEALGEEHSDTLNARRALVDHEVRLAARGDGRDHAERALDLILEILKVLDGEHGRPDPAGLPRSLLQEWFNALDILSRVFVMLGRYDDALDALHDLEPFRLAWLKRHGTPENISFKSATKLLLENRSGRQTDDSTLVALAGLAEGGDLTASAIIGHLRLDAGDEAGARKLLARAVNDGALPDPSNSGSGNSSPITRGLARRLGEPVPLTESDDSALEQMWSVDHPPGVIE